MKGATKDKWVQNLRSGKYVQGTGALHRPEGNAFCCLGVLVDQEGVPRAEGDSPGLTRFYFHGPDEWPTDLIPPEGWLGLSEEEVDVLVDMNDNEDVGFEGIADWIEENIKPEEED